MKKKKNTRHVKVCKIIANSKLLIFEEREIYYYSLAYNFCSSRENLNLHKHPNEWRKK